MQDSVFSNPIVKDGEIPMSVGLTGYGLCTTCKNMDYVTSKYGVLLAKCDNMDLRLNSANPVDRCTNFEDRMQLNLNQMYEMATLIEAAKDKIGF